MRIMLDSNAVNLLIGHCKEEATEINKQLDCIGASLYITYIQVQESMGGVKSSAYQEQLVNFIAKCEDTGLIVTKVPAVGLVGVAVMGEFTAMGISKTEFSKALGDELYRIEPNKPPGNLARDTAIGTTSLDFDVLFTGDRNLRYAIVNTIKKTGINTDLRVIQKATHQRSLYNWLFEQ